MARSFEAAMRIVPWAMVGAIALTGCTEYSSVNFETPVPTATSRPQPTDTFPPASTAASRWCVYEGIFIDTNPLNPSYEIIINPIIDVDTERPASVDVAGGLRVYPPDERNEYSLYNLDGTQDADQTPQCGYAEVERVNVDPAGQGTDQDILVRKSSGIKWGDRVDTSIPEGAIENDLVHVVVEVPKERHGDVLELLREAA